MWWTVILFMMQSLGSLISTLFTPSFEELVNMFTKYIPLRVFLCLCNKLGMINIYAQP